MQNDSKSENSTTANCTMRRFVANKVRCRSFNQSMAVSHSRACDYALRAIKPQLALMRLVIFFIVYFLHKICVKPFSANDQTEMKILFANETPAGRAARSV